MLFTASASGDTYGACIAYKRERVKKKLSPALPGDDHAVPLLGGFAYCFLGIICSIVKHRLKADASRSGAEHSAGCTMHEQPGVQCSSQGFIIVSDTIK